MSQEVLRAAVEQSPSSRRGFRMWIRRFRRDKRALFGAVILLIFIICAVFGPFITPYEPMIQSDELLVSPNLQHVLGTDNLGRDILSRLIIGARTSMIVGIIGLGLAALVGIPLGVLSGYYGGWIDMVVGRYIDIQWAFPNFIIAVMMVGIFGLGLQNVIIAIFLAYIDDFARVVRGMVMAIKQQDYVTAARATGASDLRMMLVHIFPNALPPVIVLASVFFSSAILIEAGLTFLGLGVRPDTPTWGLILNDARPFFQTAWWLAIFPGLVIMLVVLSVNFVGDAIRDIHDVHEYGAGTTGA